MRNDLVLFRAVFLLQEIPASPFRVKVDPSHDASKVKAEGPGLSKTGETEVEVLSANAVGHPLHDWALLGFSSGAGCSW